jgi:hypothetical protein
MELFHTLEIDNASVVSSRLQLINFRYVFKGSIFLMEWEAASPGHVAAAWHINYTILLNEACELVCSSQNELQREIHNALFRDRP